MQLWSRQDGHFFALDGLRAIAALLIVAFHSALFTATLVPSSIAGLPPSLLRLFLGCWVGVDIFFVLSGFLIGRILFVQLQRGAISFKAFYIRRTFRIFPAYYVVITVAVLFLTRMPIFQRLYQGLPWHTLLWRSWANYLYISNYLYGVGERVTNTMSWGWSLCIEEHFYIFLPALLTLLFRAKHQSVRLPVLGILMLLPLVARIVAFRADPHTLVYPQIYPWSHTHCDGLLVGVLIAYGHVYHGVGFARLVSRLGPLPWVVGLCCLTAVFKWGGLWTPGVFAIVFQFLILAIGAGSLLINGIFLNNWVTRVLSHPAWCPFARLSYGIYLIHAFVLCVLLRWWPTRVNLEAATSIASLLGFFISLAALSTLAAVVLFFAVERPMLMRGASLSRRFLPKAEAVEPVVQPRRQALA